MSQLGYIVYRLGHAAVDAIYVTWETFVYSLETGWITYYNEGNGFSWPQCQ
ncbi:hypothetical protein [Motilimonas pumila]|uniref:hypothetical protein n=1 Tax=Motilimonas pumila TaxID=2303987 RepID=UPI001314EE7F|nr:hypothetical protein [Motilimonas pumila]